MSTETTRRNVEYDNLNDFLSDVEKLVASNSYTTIGNWSFAQILWHLESSMTASLDGFPFMAPWYMRLGAKLMKKKIFSNKLSPGIKLPAKAAVMLPPEDATIEEALSKVQAVVSRLQNETPDKPHPFFGLLTPDEWTHLHREHAVLHMSFVLSN